MTSGEDSGSVKITSTAPTAKVAAATANAVAWGAIDARRDITVRRIRRALRVAQGDAPPRGTTPTPADNANAQQIQGLRQDIATADGSTPT